MERLTWGERILEFLGAHDPGPTRRWETAIGTFREVRCRRCDRRMLVTLRLSAPPIEERMGLEHGAPR